MNWLDVQPFTRHNFKLFQTEKVCRQQADNNYEFDENGRKLSKRVENTVGKGEIACFSFSNGVFKRLELQTHKNQGLFRKGLSFCAMVTCYQMTKF